MSVMMWHSNQFNARASSTSSALTNYSAKAAAGADISNYVVDIQINNGGTANTVSILDGSGGTVLYKATVAANSFNSAHLEIPLKFTANTAVCVTTTAAAVCDIYLNGFTSRG
jgi:hypothetical protein